MTRLDEIRARADAALAADGEGAGDIDPRMNRFIAHAREDIPWLLAEIELYQKKVVRLEQDLCDAGESYRKKVIRLEQDLCDAGYHD